MNVLLWFKRDLRINDHPALARAAGMGAVLPLYIVEPQYWTLPDTSARQWDFTAEALTDLRAQLGTIGAPLVVRVGNAVEVLARICHQNAITRIISHEETGNQWTYARDLGVKAWAQGMGMIWDELPQSGVVRRLQGQIKAPPNIANSAAITDTNIATAIEVAPAPAGKFRLGLLAEYLICIVWPSCTESQSASLTLRLALIVAPCCGLNQYSNM